MENNKTTSKTLLHLFLTAKPKVMLLKSAEQEGVCPFNMTIKILLISEYVTTSNAVNQT